MVLLHKWIHKDEKYGKHVHSPSCTSNTRQFSSIQTVCLPQKTSVLHRLVHAEAFPISHT